MVELNQLSTATTFKSLFCEYYRCSPERFEQVLFWYGLYRHALPLAALLWRWSPEFFDEDFGFIRDVAGAKNRGEVVTELNRFYGRNVRDRNLMRKMALIRLSGKRIHRVARLLFRLQKQDSLRGS